MSYLNSPSIRLQVLIDTPTLFLTCLKEQFGSLARLIIIIIIIIFFLNFISIFINTYTNKTKKKK